MSANRKADGPYVPRSQEEIEQELEDAAEERAAERAVAARKARENARALVLASLVCSAVASGVAALVVPGPMAWGVLAGGLVMTANLQGLSTLLGKVLLEEENRAASAVMLVLSFGALAGVSIWLIRQRPDMALGFALGLSVPAVAGMVYSLFRRARSVG